METCLLAAITTSHKLFYSWQFKTYYLMRRHQSNEIGNIGYSADENTILHRGVLA